MVIGSRIDLLGNGQKYRVKRLRVLGLSAVSYCARLKAIGVNLFRAVRVKRALDALKVAPESGLSAVCSAIFAVKELFRSRWRLLSAVFYQAIENQPCIAKFAA